MIVIHTGLTTVETNEMMNIENHTSVSRVSRLRYCKEGSSSG